MQKHKINGINRLYNPGWRVFWAIPGLLWAPKIKRGIACGFCNFADLKKSSH